MIMKIKHVLPILLLPFFSCSEKKEKAPEPEIRKEITQIEELDWTVEHFKTGEKTAGLSSYRYKSSQLRTLLSDPALIGFRFKLIMNNNKIEAQVVGVDANGVEFGTITGTPYHSTISLNDLGNLPIVTPAQLFAQGNLAQHVIQPDETKKYVEKWNDLIFNGSNLKPYTSYNNVNIRYYAVKKGVIEALTNNQSDALLLWGLNDNDKLTPILLDSKILANGLQIVYDRFKPCPPFCGLNF